MNRRIALAATAVGHAALAAFVAGHAAVTDREAGYWPYLTLVFGIVGLAGYLRSGES